MSSLVGICNGVFSSVTVGDGFVMTCSVPFIGVDFGTFLGSSGLDVDALSIAFGGCLLMFALGSGIGIFINILRKARL